MPRKTLVLIISLFIVSIALLSLALVSNNKAVPQVQNQIISLPSPTPSAQTILALSPNPLSISSNAGTLTVSINTQENIVKGVQLEIGYDPKLITMTQITPASFFTNPQVIFPKEIQIDNKQGKIYYAITDGENGKKGQGDIITLHFTSRLGVNQSSQISFLSRTGVISQGNFDSTLSTSSGTTLYRQSAVTR